jgi:hypothetical protein
VRTLIHLADTSPALRKVWAEVCQSSEDLLATILAERTTPDTAPDAAHETAPDTKSDNVAPSRHLRLTSAVASAAVRVAVESWAAGTASPSGAEGPAALALRNLGALRGFAWEEQT